MKRQHLKLFVRNIVKEAVLREIFDVPIQNMKPNQKIAVDALIKRNFSIKNIIPAKNGIIVVLLRAKTSDWRPEREAKVMPDGTINEPNVDIKRYLTFIDDPVKETMTTRAELDAGMMKAVNVEGIHDERPCDCGSGLMSHWEMDARDIPLCRVCPKCKAEKLKKFRPDVLTNPNYEADEPIEPEEYEEQTGTGAVAGYSTPFAFKKKVRENEKKSDYERHGPCSCGSGLPAYAKLDAKGKPIARVCKRCDRKQRTKIKGLAKSPEPIKPYDDDLTEVAGFGLAVLSTVGGLAIYKILRKIIDNYNVTRMYDNVRMTNRNINILFKAAKIQNPKLKDSDIELIRTEIGRAMSNGTITTMADLKKYLEGRTEGKMGKVGELNIKEMIGIDGRYQNDMASGVTAKKLAGLDEDIKTDDALTIVSMLVILIASIHLFRQWIESQKDINQPVNKRVIRRWFMEAIKDDQSYVNKQLVSTIEDEIDKKINDGTIKTMGDAYEYITWLAKKLKKEVEGKGREENGKKMDEMTGTGAVAGYSTPFAFSRKSKEGSPRAIAAAKKYGKVVKSISTESIK